MNKSDIKSCLLTSAAILALSLLFCMSGGILHIAASVLISVLIGASITKHHYIFIGLCSALALAIITGIYTVSLGPDGFMAGISESAKIVLVGGVLGISSNLKLSPGRAAMVCGAIYLVNNLVGLAAADATFFDPQAFNQIKEVLFETLKTQYAGYEEVLENLEKDLSLVSSLSYRIIPASMMTGAGISGFITTLVYKKMLPKLNKNANVFESFSNLRADRTASVVYLLIIIFGFSIPNPLMADAFLNLFVIMSFAFYLFGLTYFDYKMKRKGTKKSTRRIVVAILLPLSTLLFALPGLIVIATGFIDGLFDLRRKRIKEGEDGPQ